MIYLDKCSQNQAFVSEDRVQTRLFHSYMTLVTWKIRSKPPKSILFLKFFELVLTETAVSGSSRQLTLKKGASGDQV